MKKRYIEYDLPLADISDASAKEKYVSKKHPTSIHTWWARRPLAASRSTIFASLIDLPEKQSDLIKIDNMIKKILPWSSVKDRNNNDVIRAINYIKKEWEVPPKVYDPFAGGGSIPLEATRLGCEVYSSDYNPVAVLIQKATLEWPQKFRSSNVHKNKKKIVLGV